MRFTDANAPARPGHDLLGLLLERGSRISYLCMAGSCGTCLVRVRSGSEHLEAPTASEVANCCEAADCRLACQAIVRGTGDVVIEPA